MSGNVFFGYDSEPELSRETLFNASRAISKTGVATATSWEELKTSGRVLIGRIRDTIDTADACAFDVSTMNQNVLFELGYAIARAKPLLILLDKTDSEAKRRWREFQLLKSVGYKGWENVDDIRSAFLEARPDLAKSTVYDDLIEPELGASVPGSILYLPTAHNTEPARMIDRRLEYDKRRGVHLLTADPTESGLFPLGWYASKAYETACTIVHFEAPRRSQASLHNSRSALVAGLANGLDRPILMLAEEDYSPPIDYEEELQPYSSARECLLLVDKWLRELSLQPKAAARSQRVRLASELRTLRFGEHVAENEADTLSEYFIDTSALDDVVATRNSLFIGRKGTGKTANMLQAAARLSEDVRNLVVVIKPASYEYVSLLELLSKLPVSLQQYSIESLLGPVLKSRQRVAVLIDNLDKGWDRDADLKLLAKLLLGLLAAVGRVISDFDREDYWRDRIRLTLALFLRSDIFAYLRAQAREPDKLPISRLVWRDSEVLLRVIEERFLAARPENTEAEELWDRFFCPTVGGTGTREYIVDRCLPRPRDIIYWCNATVGIAANRRHERVEEADVLDGERTYSQFAYEALLVENGITIELLKDVLLQFLGESATLDQATVRRLVGAGGVKDSDVDSVFQD